MELYLIWSNCKLLQINTNTHTTPLSSAFQMPFPRLSVYRRLLVSQRVDRGCLPPCSAQLLVPSARSLRQRRRRNSCAPTMISSSDHDNVLWSDAGGQAQRRVSKGRHLEMFLRRVHVSPFQHL